MKPDKTMILHAWLLRLVPRLAPILLIILGWHFWEWPGAIIGLVVGCVVWFALWIIGTYFLAKERLKRQRQEMTALATEELKKLAVDPSQREMAFAISELERRGIKNIRPARESLLELLTSANPNQRALAFSYLSVLYPAVFAKITPAGSASTDAPEIWRERIAALGEVN